MKKLFLLFLPWILGAQVYKVKFTLEAPDAKSVYLAGEFNSWSPTATPMKKRDGVWEVEISLKPGTYQYKFVVDGRWCEDPKNPWKVDDGFGGFNSVVKVTDDGKVYFGFPPEEGAFPVTFRIHAPTAHEVYLAGTFNNWNPKATKMIKKDGYWEVTINLKPGIYQYKFVIDGKWREDPKNPWKTDDGFGGFNSVLRVTEEGKVVYHEEKKEIVDNLKPAGKPIYLMILWHQHQPRYFKDPETGEYEKPWVRLHAVKDYYDMAAILKEYPKIHLAINLTPVLIMQLQEMIERYEKGLPMDKYMRLTLKPANKLTKKDKEFLILNFFSANWQNMIDIYPRYRELRLKRVMNPDGTINLSASIKNYTTQDFRDLQVWFNLAWLDPDFKEKEVELPDGEVITAKDLVEIGKNFTEKDKKRLMEIHYKIMKNVLAIHKELQDKGQIEITTTPFYHPILPLLCDNGRGFRYPQDAKAHVEKAVKLYEKIFGKKPVGMWPAEGAVSKSVIPIFADAGIKWIATDEKVLAKTFGKDFCTDYEKYKVYKAIAEDKFVYIVFRDTRLSDDIGFRYCKMHPIDAANDFISKLYEIHKKFANSKEPILVTVILDGENCWENYKHDGKEFLHSLYSQLQRAKWVKTVYLSEFIRENPPEATLHNLWSGSWINADFSTWIGEFEENLAWDYLLKVRKDVEKWENVPDRVWEEVYAAEGSDWFWWYGRDQYTPDEAEYDKMFRKTLENIYILMGKEPPSFLKRKILIQ